MNEQETANETLSIYFDIDRYIYDRVINHATQSQNTPIRDFYNIKDIKNSILQELMNIEKVNVDEINLSQFDKYETHEPYQNEALGNLTHNRKESLTEYILTFNLNNTIDLPTKTNPNSKAYYKDLLHLTKNDQECIEHFGRQVLRKLTSGIAKPDTKFNTKSSAQVPTDIIKIPIKEVMNLDSFIPDEYSNKPTFQIQKLDGIVKVLQATAKFFEDHIEISNNSITLTSASQVQSETLNNWSKILNILYSTSIKQQDIKSALETKCETEKQINTRKGLIKTLREFYGSTGIGSGTFRLFQVTDIDDFITVKGKQGIDYTLAQFKTGLMRYILSELAFESTTILTRAVKDKFTNYKMATKSDSALHVNIKGLIENNINSIITSNIANSVKEQLKNFSNNVKIQDDAKNGRVIITVNILYLIDLMDALKPYISAAINNPINDNNKLTFNNNNCIFTYRNNESTAILIQILYISTEICSGIIHPKYYNRTMSYINNSSPAKVIQLLFDDKESTAPDDWLASLSLIDRVYKGIENIYTIVSLIVSPTGNSTDNKQIYLTKPTSPRKLANDQTKSQIIFKHSGDVNSLPPTIYENENIIVEAEMSEGKKKIIRENSITGDDSIKTKYDAWNSELTVYQGVYRYYIDVKTICEIIRNNLATVQSTTDPTEFPEIAKSAVTQLHNKKYAYNTLGQQEYTTDMSTIAPLNVFMCNRYRASAHGEYFDLDTETSKYLDLKNSNPTDPVLWTDMLKPKRAPKDISISAVSGRELEINPKWLGKVDVFKIDAESYPYIDISAKRTVTASNDILKFNVFYFYGIDCQGITNGQSLVSTLQSGLLLRYINHLVNENDFVKAPDYIQYILDEEGNNTDQGISKKALMYTIADTSQPISNIDSYMNLIKSNLIVADKPFTTLNIFSQDDTVKMPKAVFSFLDVMYIRSVYILINGFLNRPYSEHYDNIQGSRL